MAWRELRLVVPRRDFERASAAAFAAGAAGVQEAWLPGEAPPPRQPWDTGPAPPLPSRQVLIAWFEDPDRNQVDAQLPADLGEPTWADVDDVDWETSWQRGFAPVVITPRITLAPPWDAPPGALIIEPGQGFGTGHHPSTRGALRLMDAVLDDVGSCLDVGSGSGVLALAARRAGATVWGIDVEASAAEDATHNAALNGLDARFDTTPLREVARTFDLVAANLHAELLVALAPDLVRVTGTWLVCAGILADREHLVRAALDPHLNVQNRESDSTWVCLRYTRQARQ